MAPTIQLYILMRPFILLALQENVELNYDKAWNCIDWFTMSHHSVTMIVKKKISFYVICNIFKYCNWHYFYEYITTQTHFFRKIILYFKFFAINVFCWFSYLLQCISENVKGYWSQDVGYQRLFIFGGHILSSCMAIIHLRFTI